MLPHFIVINLVMLLYYSACGYFIILRFLLLSSPVRMIADATNQYETYYLFDNGEFHEKFLSNPSTVPAAQPGFYDPARAVDTTVPLVSSGQAEQDVFTFKHLGNKANGFFVDLAANHYKSLSNTYALETQMGWNGICIEANPEYYEGILANRRCKLVTNPVTSYSNMEIIFYLRSEIGSIVSTDRPVDLNATSISRGTGLISKAYKKMNTVTLERILDYFQAPHVIDYLSLDIEGSEYNAMHHFDFGQYKFLTMSVERPVEKLHHLLMIHGYRYVTRLAAFGDVIYIHHTHPSFVSIMNEYRSEGKGIYFWIKKKEGEIQVPYLNKPTWAEDHLNPASTARKPFYNDVLSGVE